MDEMTDMVGSFDPTASDDFPNGKSIEQTDNIQIIIGRILHDAKRIPDH